MLPHPVVDQTISPNPLDAASIVLYAIVFVAVAVATRRRPAYGVAALIALVPFAFYRDIGMTTITFPKVALLATVAGLVARRCDARALREPVTRTLVLCATAVAAATALSIAQAAHPAAAVRETGKSIEYLLIFATVAIAARTDPDDTPVRFAFAATSLVVSVLSILEVVTGAPSGFWMREHAIPRVAGPLEGPNQLSAYLSITLCVVAAFAIARKPLAAERFALPLGCAALALTISRAGVTTALVGLAVVALVTRGRSTRFVPAAVLAGIGAGVVLLAAWGVALADRGGAFALLGRFSTFGDTLHGGGVGTRGELWSAALALWQDHPFFGIGAGNFERELGRVGLPDVRTHANSLYLQALVEGGIPLLLATVASAFAPIVRFARGPFDRPFVVAALGASVALALHQIVDLLVFYTKVGDAWWILLALGAARADAARVERASAPARAA